MTFGGQNESSRHFALGQKDSPLVSANQAAQQQLSHMPSRRVKSSPDADEDGRGQPGAASKKGGRANAASPLRVSAAAEPAQRPKLPVSLQRASSRRDELVDSVADLTASRDREALEIAFATMLLELTKVASVILWRVIRRDGVTMLQKRAHVDAKGSIIAHGVANEAFEGLVPIDARPILRMCYAAKRLLRHSPDKDGAHQYIFPVSNGQNIGWLVEMLSDAHLRSDQERLALGMLRIFFNHVSVLEYGDFDELTGLLNRRTFDETFNRIASRGRGEIAGSQGAIVNRRTSAKTGQHSELAVLDIDFFKRVNDQFGHPYGDEVLVLFARLMTKSFRDTDQLFRFGGEEFVVLLNDISKREAHRALERFRVAVSSFLFPQVGKITVSIGHTSIINGDTGSAAFGRADLALYAAKQKGRNRTLSYESLLARGAISTGPEVKCDIELF